VLKIHAQLIQPAVGVVSHDKVSAIRNHDDHRDDLGERSFALGNVLRATERATYTGGVVKEQDSQAPDGPSGSSRDWVN
jgi:hypothetical protein